MIIPLSKHTTYRNTIDRVRVSLGILDNPLFTNSLIVSFINKAIFKLNRLIDYKTHPLYVTSAVLEGDVWNLAEDDWEDSEIIFGTLIIGNENPYTVDLSAIEPFLSKIEKIVHITSSGARTVIKNIELEEIENIQNLTSIYSNSIFYAWEGDSIKIFKGSLFPFNTGSDSVEILFRRLPITSTNLDNYLDIPDSYTDKLINDVEKEIQTMKQIYN